jgi:hypothetical protein
MFACWTSTVALADAICSKVVDPGDRPLPNAALKIVDLSDATKHYVGQTDREGNLCISKIPEGLYSVEASLPGFLNVRYYPVRVVFPREVHLEFRLPIGYIGEGGIAPESVLNGTLKRGGEPAGGIKICLFDGASTTPSACDNTDDLGEYALTVAPGKYAVELSDRGKLKMPRRQIDLSVAGQYRDRLSLDAP